jgi:energy-coupling factor transporter ATP-binding protein EcfA2
MARARNGGSVKPKLNILAYGPTGAGKSTILLQMAYFKREDGTPWRILLLDHESGGADEAIEELEKNGIDTRNIYIVYTQSIKETKDYINKVRDHEPFYELDDCGDETDEIVKDAYGNQFVPDAIITDGTSVLKLTNTQSLLDLSRKRNKIKAEKSGATAEEKFVATANANLELKDYSQLNYAGQDLVLTLMACGVHVGITAREKDETITVQTDDGKTTSVSTGKKTFDSYKGMDYNVKTILRMFRDEDDQVCCVVEKDRTKRHPVGTILEDPSLLDWEEVVSSGNNKKEFIIKNDLDKAIEADQKIFEKQMLGGDSVSEVAAPKNDNVAELQAAIKSVVNGLSPVEKKAMKEKLTKAELPTAFNKVTDEDTLKKILAAVSE